MSRRQRVQAVAAGIWAVVTAACLVYVLLNREVSVEKLLALMPPSPAARIGVLAALFSVQGMFPLVPYDAIVLCASLLFSLPQALVINALGTLVCVSVPYLIGRLSQSDWVRRTIAKSEKLRRILLVQEQSGEFLLSFVLRMLGLSNMVIGLFCGSVHMRGAEFLLGSVLGILPAMLCFTVLGSAWDLHSPLLWCVLGADLAATAVTYFLFRRRAGRLPVQGAPQPAPRPAERGGKA